MRFLFCYCSCCFLPCANVVLPSIILCRRMQSFSLTIFRNAGRDARCVFITSMHGLCCSRLSIPTVVVTTSISAWPPPSAEIPLLVERSVLFWPHICTVLQSHVQFGPGYTSTVSGAMNTSECFQAVDLHCVWGHEHW